MRKLESGDITKLGGSCACFVGGDRRYCGSQKTRAAKPENLDQIHPMKLIGIDQFKNTLGFIPSFRFTDQPVRIAKRERFLVESRFYGAQVLEVETYENADRVEVFSTLPVECSPVL